MKSKDRKQLPVSSDRDAGLGLPRRNDRLRPQRVWSNRLRRGRHAASGAPGSNEAVVGPRVPETAVHQHRVHVLLRHGNNGSRSRLKHNLQVPRRASQARSAQAAARGGVVYSHFGTVLSRSCRPLYQGLARSSRTFFLCSALIW